MSTGLVGSIVAVDCWKSVASGCACLRVGWGHRAWRGDPTEGSAGATHSVVLSGECRAGVERLGYEQFEVDDLP
jgi:hypothetical protein